MFKGRVGASVADCVGDENGGDSLLGVDGKGGRSSTGSLGALQWALGSARFTEC